MDTAALKKLLADKPIPELLPALASDAAFHSLLPVIDAELARRTQHLQDLQTFRNGVASPVIRLPLEVISKILLHLALQSEDTAYNLWWRRHTLVCRRWREAALKTPKLWSFADFTVGLRSFSVLELNRGRAQDYPLSVKFAVRPGTKRYWAAGKQLFWDSRRLRSLNLDMLPKQAQTFLDRILPDHHPGLEALRVTSCFLDLTGKDRAPMPDDLAIARLSDEFLLDMTPELRRLYLLDISYSWSALRNLTHLTVGWSEAWVEKFKLDWSMRDIVEALGRCPGLIKVVMRPLPPAIPDDRIPDVKLPALREFEFSGPAESCGQLIQATTIPCTAILTIDAIHSGDDAEALRPLVEGLGRHYADEAPLMQTLDCTTTQVEGRGDTYFFNTYGDGKLHTAADYNSRAQSYLFTLNTYPQTPEALHRVIELVIPAMPFHNITLLDWRGTYRQTAEARAMVVEKLPSLRTIAVRLVAKDVALLLETLAILRQRGLPFVGCVYLDAEVLRWLDRYRGSGAVESAEKIQAALGLLISVVAHVMEAKHAGQLAPESIELADAPEMLIESILPAEMARFLGRFTCNGILYARAGEGEDAAS